MAALAEEGELEDELLAKKRECDLVKEKRFLSPPQLILQLSSVTLVIAPTTPTWAKVFRHRHLHHHLSII